MRRIRWILAVACIALGVCRADGQIVANPFGEPVSAATAIVRVTADPGSGFMNRGLFENLVIADEALLRSAVENISPDAAKLNHVAQIMIDEASTSQLPPNVFGIVVTSYDERVPAGKILPRLVDLVAKKLTKLDSPGQDQEKSLQTDQRVQYFAAKLRNSKAEYADIARAGNSPLNPELAEQRQSQREAQREALEIELQGLSARQKVLEERIAEAAVEANDKPANDPVLAELKQAVQLRQTALSRLRTLQSSGTVAEVAVRDAELTLVTAKTELARYMAGRADGQRVTELRHRLEDTTIDRAECEAKQKALAALLEKPTNAATLGEKRVEIELLEREYRQASEELMAIRTKIDRYQPPSVTILTINVVDLKKKP